MAEPLLEKGTIAFQAEGRLLQELGLRLVASPEVALVELIKNAYDADSPSCKVYLEANGKTLIVVDEGSGMTFTDFSTKWMRIATANKLGNEFSARYSRRLTGAKGIGRFAVRYLGDHLVLESTATDKQRGCKTRLTATFNWTEVDKVTDISKVNVNYQLARVPDDTSTGTKLIITNLRSGASFVDARNLRDEVLRMVSPLSGLDSGRFTTFSAEGKDDPGFNVSLPGSGDAEEVDIAKLVLDNHWARLTIDLTGTTLKFKVFLSTSRETTTLKCSVPSAISKGFFADIRYFPKRKGVFSNIGVNGQLAWQWVRTNCGVSVVDHGFRIKPYGFRNNDWLKLDIDSAHNERDWRSNIAREQFPIPDSVRNLPGENPALNLATNYQIVGAVFIESTRLSEANDDLIPAMDREGLLANTAAQQLEEYVRAGIEFLAREDKAEMERLAAVQAKELARAVRQDVKKAIEHIEKSATLTKRDKTRIVKQYAEFAKRLDEQEEYSEKARKSLTMMSLLGVVAGFMTHESQAAVHDLEQAASLVQKLAKKNPELAEAAKDLSVRLSKFRSYVEYARLFVKKVGAPELTELNAKGQINHITGIFGQFAKDRGIDVSCDAAGDVTTPPLPVVAYSGILVNLYTNALKAVMAVQSSLDEPKICFHAWNEKKKHIVEICDNGVGIPEELRKRIWDPLFTTTSDRGNPLGSGMGLGLTLVKQVASEFHGSVSLIQDVPPGFTTCFRVEFPF